MKSPKSKVLRPAAHYRTASDCIARGNPNRCSSTQLDTCSFYLYSTEHIHSQLQRCDILCSFHIFHNWIFLLQFCSAFSSCRFPALAALLVFCTIWCCTFWLAVDGDRCHSWDRPLIRHHRHHITVLWQRYHSQHSTASLPPLRKHI